MFKPVRRYFHSRTLHPRTTFEYDSDQEGADFVPLFNELLEEFTDVNVAEKTFMKVWNAFMRRDHVTADKQMRGLLEDFVGQFGPSVGVTEEQWSKHLLSLWDHGVISGEVVSEVMDLFTSKSGQA